MKPRYLLLAALLLALCETRRFERCLQQAPDRLNPDAPDENYCWI